jgi:hypothetical protein
LNEEKTLNIKNRPNPNQLNRESSPLYWLHQYNMWFEDFKKQEQQKQVRDENRLWKLFKKHYLNIVKTKGYFLNSNYFLAFCIGYECRGKEFLGVNE